MCLEWKSLSRSRALILNFELCMAVGDSVSAQLNWHMSLLMPRVELAAIKLLSNSCIQLTYRVASLPVSLDDRMSTVGEAVTDDALLIVRRSQSRREIHHSGSRVNLMSDHHSIYRKNVG